MTLTDPSQDIALLAAIQNGDAVVRANAFSVLYRRHQGALYRFAMLRVGSADSAADIVQEIFLALMTGKLNFDPARGALQSFLFGVARNLALKRESARAKFISVSDFDTADDDAIFGEADFAQQPAERLLADERAEIVRQALLKLTPHYRDVLILYEMHDCSYVDIAQICDIDIGTVRSRLSRARARMMILLVDLNQNTQTHAASQKHL